MGLRETMNELKRLVITEKLMECGGNVSECARVLQVSRTTLDRLCGELIIDVPRVRSYVNRNYKYKLTEVQEQELKALGDNGIDTRSLIKKFDVSKTTVNIVKRGRRRIDADTKSNVGRNNDNSRITAGKSRFETCTGSDGVNEGRIQ